MMSLEDFKFYLPRYLTEESQKNLFEEIKKFPKNIDGRVFTTKLKKEPTIFQGDGLADLPVISFPSEKVSQAKVLVVSNSCDIDPANKRPFGARVCYAPIFSLSKYKEGLIENGILNEEAATQHVETIRSQEITQIYYLPYNDTVGDEGIIFLDRINNLDRRHITNDQIKQIRLFTLSDYGFYLFLIKISIHFTRIGEKVDRSN